MTSAATDAAEETFSLTALIRSELERGHIADPHDLADLLEPKIPDEELRGIVRHTLPDLIREQIAYRRRALRVAALADRDGQPVEGNGSRKWRGVSEMTGDPWSHQEYVGGEWRFLGTLTVEDCVALARQYTERASENTTQAKRWRALAKLMKERGAARLDEVPFEDVQAVLSS